jgi:two-component system cell cycle sensor histidine kinase/response regulator CckA
MTIRDLPTANSSPEEPRAFFHNFFEKALDGCGMGAAILDFRCPERRILSANDVFCRARSCGKEDLVGKPGRVILSGETSPSARLQVETGLQEGVVSKGIFHRPGQETEGWREMVISPFPDAGGEVVYLVVIETDATLHKGLEEHLRQRQRLETVGHMAGGVAHDFNNMLQAIMGFCSLLHLELPRESPSRQHLNQMEEALNLSLNLTRQLLTFVRHAPVEVTAVDLHTIISHLQPIVASLLRENVQLRFLPDPDPLWVRVDRDRLEQAILNLIINSRDAITGAGKITIRTGHERHEVPWDTPFSRMAAGGYVVIEVTDDGSGMDEKTMSRLFEPFFTTKVRGHGTGLGLAMVFRVMEDAGGGIDVTTAPGQGTTFRLYLPREAPGVPPPYLPPETGCIPVLSEGSPWRILLVDDDPLVNRSTRSLLQRRGYEVESAFDGVEALDCLERGTSFDLIITDVVMPRMGGLELVRQVRQRHPSMPIILISGYSEEQEGSAKFPRDCPFLAKPFAWQDLAALIEKTVRKE